MNKEILKSLIIYTSITAGLTYCIVTLLNTFISPSTHIWVAVALGVAAIQWFIWNLYTAYLDKKTQKADVSAIEVAQQIERMFDQYGATVQCSYCKKNVLIPIKASTDNSFECPSCEEENAVYVSIETAQKTLFTNDILPDNTKGIIPNEASLSDTSRKSN